MTPKGLKVLLLSEKGSVHIEPFSKTHQERYISYWSRDYVSSNPDFEYFCGTTNDQIPPTNLTERSSVAKVPLGDELRTYRLAMAVDSSFYNLAGGNNASTMAEVVAILNQVNTLFERDVSIRMILIDNTDDLFFTETTAPYPYTSMNACNLRAENQTIIDNLIGEENYDIGHALFTSFSSGCAAGNSVCNTNFKSYGVTGWTNPFTDPFFSGVVSHEMGHQFNASHTWNGPNCAAGQWAPNSSYEPGTGSTIMGYPSVCGADDNVQSFFDFNFHLHSINQMSDFSRNGNGNDCASISNTGNAIPTVNAGVNYTIPVNTPFILSGSGSDSDGDALTYSWEQFDLGPQVTPNDPTTSGPLFRSFPPTSSPSRTFPQISDILNNVNTKGEILPTIGRELNFSITVRDNRAGGGGVNSDDMIVTVDGNIGPFRVTGLDSSTSICPGDYTVTWNVNDSDDLSPNVNILLSYDGGNTFTETLAASTPNDGSKVVDIPCTFSSQARIKIEAAENIFFDINNTNFSIGDNSPPSFTVPATTTIFLDEDCDYDADPLLTGEPTNVSDDCDPNPMVSSFDTISAGECGAEVFITRTWVVVDACGLQTVEDQLIRVFDRIDPTFTVPEDAIIFADENCEYDADPSITGEPTDLNDNCDPMPMVTYSDVSVPGECVGEEIITRTWRVTDACSNFTMQDQIITVKDELPPIITNVSASPNSLWPPNHKMVDVFIAYDSEDNCSEVTNSLSVVSNEDVNGTGDGNTSPDWIVIDENNVQLRAERSGQGTGRIYTITITSEDDCGNSSTDDVEVYVPHSRGKSKMIVSAKVFPNPSNDSFYLRISEAEHVKLAQVEVRIVNSFGQVMETLMMTPNQSVIFGNQYPTGNYFVHFMNDNELIKTLQVVKN